MDKFQIEKVAKPAQLGSLYDCADMPTGHCPVHQEAGMPFPAVYVSSP